MQRLSSDRVSRFAHGLGTLVPDAMSASVILLLIVAAAALAFGNTFAAITDAYYRGLWMLLPFTMQITPRSHTCTGASASRSCHSSRSTSARRRKRRAFP